MRQHLLILILLAFALCALWSINVSLNSGDCPRGSVSAAGMAQCK